MSVEAGPKVALVTGASKGIGAEIAKRLARDGFSVAVNYASNPGKAEAVVDEIRRLGREAVAICADVSDPAAVRSLFDQTEEKLGSPYALVNNAGVMDLAPVAEMSDASFDRMVAVNLKGTFNCLREAASRLRSGGRIVNTSSTVTRTLQPTYGTYGATKAAIEVLTMTIARELRGRSITVNAIAPGPTATDLFLNGKPQSAIDAMARLSPMERLGQPSDIASVVSFIVGPDGGWINGQTIWVNGGMA